jgi:signal transduction histidine kinase
MIRQLRSTSAKLAVAIGAAFLVAFALLGGIVHYAVSAQLLADAREVISADASGLMNLFRQAGRDGLIEEVRNRSKSPADPDAVYAIIGADGRVIAGSVHDLPLAARDATLWFEFKEHREQGAVRVMAKLQPIGGGEFLLTGLRARAQDRMLAMLLRTALAALCIAALLGAVIGWLTSRWVSRRLRHLDQTAARVGAGELMLRVPVDPSDDAFSRLAIRFNGMLDRIQELMSLVRHATDHIAHDLRTPLTRLRNRLELLHLDSRYEHDAKALEAAIVETDQLLQSFGALLRLARIEAQELDMDLPAVDLVQLVADVVELYTPNAAERGVVLQTSVVPCLARGDADQLFQVLVNLLDNALKHAPRGSAIDLSLRIDGEWALFSIADCGPGIPAGERERVLERFVRLEAHRGSAGTGLGLSIVRAIVRRHGGRIELSDNEPGLRVRVRLSMARA